MSGPKTTSGRQWMLERIARVRAERAERSLQEEDLKRGLEELREGAQQEVEEAQRPGSSRRSKRPTLDAEFFRKDAPGTVRYVERPDGTRMRMHARGDGSMVALEPGTPEFHARYTQPPEPIIEQLTPDGPEGYRWRKLDQEGNPLED